MSRHSSVRVPGRGRILARQFRADPWPTLLLALLVALVAGAATLWPRLILDMNGRQAPYQISALSPQQRDLIAPWSSTMVPQGGREYVSAEDTWGPLIEGLERTRQAQPEPLRSMMGTGDFFIEVGRGTVLEPPEGTAYAQVIFQERLDPLLEEHVDLVSGEWPQVVLNASPQLPAEEIPEGTPSGPVQILLLDAAAERLDLEAGDEFADYLVTGTFAPKDPEDVRWAHMPNSVTVGELYDGNAGLSALVTGYLPPASPGSTGPITNNVMRLFYPLDASAVRGDQVEQVTAQLIAMTATQQDLRMPATEAELNTTFNDPGVNLWTPPIQSTFATESLSTFEGLSEQQRATASILAVVAAGPVGVALAVLALASRLIVSRRQQGLALATARGGSPAQVRGSLALEGLAAGVPAAVAGHYAAGLVDLPHSGWSEWVPVGLIALTPAALLALSASTLTRSTRADLSSRGASRLRLLLEVIVLGLAGLAVWRLFDRGLTGVSTDAETAGPGGAAQVVQVDTGVDVLMAATPVLLALAACVITLRLYPVPVHALLSLFRRGRGLTNFLGAARAVRDPAGGVMPALAVILGVSVAVLSSVLASTINTGAEQAVWRNSGADVRMSGPSWSDEETATVGEVDGVAQIAAVRPATQTADLSGDIATRGVTIYIVDSTLPEVWADTPLPALPADLFAASSSTPVLTGGELEGDSGVATLQNLGPVEVVGHVDDLPGVRTRGEFLVVDRAQWEAAGGSTPNGQVLLVKAADSGQVEALTTALNTVVPNAFVETPQAKLEVYREAPITGSMSWLLAAAVVATTVLTVLAVLFVQLMGAAGRTSLLAVLRTLGLSQRQARGLTAWELGPLVAMAFAVGAGLGVLVPWLLLKAIDLTGLTGGTAQPTLAIDWAVLGPVALGILAAVALAIGISAALSGRADLTSTLRSGEER